MANRFERKFPEAADIFNDLSEPARRGLVLASLLDALQNLHKSKIHVGSPGIAMLRDIDRGREISAERRANARAEYQYHEEAGNFQDARVLLGILCLSRGLLADAFFEAMFARECDWRSDAMPEADMTCLRLSQALDTQPRSGTSPFAADLPVSKPLGNRS